MSALRLDGARALVTGILCALALAPTLRAQDSERDAPQPSTAELKSDLSQLPLAPDGRWSEWQPSDPIPEALREAMIGGTRAYFAADYGAAVAHYWQILRDEPDFPPALYQLGVTYFRLRRYGDCARAFERFLRVAPHQEGATQALAHSYYSLGDYARAQTQYERVVAANPTSVEAVRGLALTLMRNGDLPAALGLFERCLELKPDHPDALFWKAQVQFDMGRSEEARATVERARDLDAFDPRPWFLLSRVLFDLGQDDAAVDAERRFSTLNELAQKVRTLEGLLLHDPHQLEVFSRLLDVHQASGNKAAVRATCERMGRSFPRDMGVRVMAMGALLDSGDVEASQRVADTIERDFAEDAEAWRALRDYYGKRGDRVRQIRAGERYLRLKG